MSLNQTPLLRVRKTQVNAGNDMTVHDSANWLACFGKPESLVKNAW